MNKLLQAIPDLPLDLRTIALLQNVVKVSSHSGLAELTGLVRHFQLNEDSKSLETIIYNTYFQWCNDQPQHIRRFRTHYGELRDHWPYERHRSLLTMESPRNTSIRHMWNNSVPKVLSAMKYSKHKWADATAPYDLSEIQRTLLFNEIFQHYLFLKKSPNLCKYKKNLPIPIVEIPMKPLGQDIPDVRTANLFKRKVSNTWNFLAIENPVLSLENEQLLLDILDSPQGQNVKSSRWLRRTYQRACKRAYVIRPHSVIGLSIEPSKLVKRL